MATRKQVREFVTALPDQYLECRQFGHSWRPSTVDREGPRFRVGMVCRDCESKRHHVIDAKGMFVGHPSITYVKGYLAPHGLGRLVGEARGVVRLEGVARMIESLGPAPQD